MDQTQRGFAIKRFKDRYGCNCSIQKSSLATEDAIWFGIDAAFPSAAETVSGTIPERRMHLTQEMVAELLPLLQHFVETGELDEQD